MKPFLAYLLAPLWLMPNAVFAGEPETPFAVPQTVASVQVASEPHVVSSPVVRFRDLFMAASINEVEESKPYRLSLEERHRMREQLRGQAPMDLYKK